MSVNIYNWGVFSLCRLRTVSVRLCRTWVRAVWSWYRTLAKFRVIPTTRLLAATSRSTLGVSVRRSPLFLRRSSPDLVVLRPVLMRQVQWAESSLIWTPPLCLPLPELCVQREMTVSPATGNGHLDIWSPLVLWKLLNWYIPSLSTSICAHNGGKSNYCWQ